MTTPGGQLTPGDEPEIGDPPQFGVPSGAYVGDAGSPQSFKDLNTLNKDEAKRRMRQPLEGMFGRQRESVWGNGGLLGHIADLLFGPGTAGPAQRLSDGMTALNNRLDLMSDVSGYCGAFMSNNYRFEGGNNYKKLRFDSLYGPPKNASLDAANHRIVLAKGTWSVSLLTAMSPIDATTWVRAHIDCRAPDGSLHSRRWLDGRSGPQNGTQFHQVPVIARENGYYIEAHLTHDAWWWTVMGGTERTLLFVNRWDIRTTNDFENRTPGNGGDVT